MGRADQTAKVRGMFVHPRQVGQVVKKTPEIIKALLEVTVEDGKDGMVLICETLNSSDELAGKIATTIKTECWVRGEVKFVEPGALPNDGKAIDDCRGFG